MDVKDSYLHGTIGVVKSISVNADKLTYTLADINQTATTVTLPVATQSANGLLSSADKIKLDKSTGINQSIPYIVGPDTDTTAGTWTGTYSGITEYNDGLTIIYVPKVAGASTTTLNINNIGSKVCYYNGSSKLTTHYPAGTPILLTYSGGYWKRSDYYYDSSQLRVYRQTTGYDADYPILVSRTLASSIGTSGSDNSYSNIYGLIGNDTTKTPTINPLTGEIKASKFTGIFNGTANSVANSLTLKIKSGATEGTSLYTYNGSSDKTLDIKQGDNVTLTAAEGSLTIAASDSKVTQTDYNDSSNLRVLLSYNASDNSTTASVRKSSKLKFNTGSGTLIATTFSGGLLTDSDVLPSTASLANAQCGFFTLNSTVSGASGYAGDNTGFPVSNNANSILWLGTHSRSSDTTKPGHGHQLGFSSNGNLYHRMIQYGVFPTTENGESWKKLAYISDIPTKVSQLTNDSGYLTSHQSLANYVTLTTEQTITGEKTFNANIRLKSPIIKSIPTDGGDGDSWIQLQGYPNYGIRYYNSSIDKMAFSASGNNHTIVGSDLCINGAGDGTVTIRGKKIYHEGNLTNVSQLINDSGYVTGGPYLPLAGGVMNDGALIKWNESETSYDWESDPGKGFKILRYNSTKFYGTGIHIGDDFYRMQLAYHATDGNFKIRTKTTQTTSFNTWNTLIHSNNYTSYLGYIGTTAVQSTSANQALTGITNATMSGTTTTKQLVISSTANEQHLTFSREGANYIIFPETGYLTFGTTNGNVGIKHILTHNYFSPYDNVTSTLGTTSRKWDSLYVTNVYTSTLTSDSGLIKGDLVLTTNTNITPKLRFQRNTNTDSYCDYYMYVDSDARLKLGYNLNGTDTSFATFYIDGHYTGNSATTNKLKTAVTLWGQSFDGSADISGNMTGVSSINNNVNFSTATTNLALLNIAATPITGVNYMHLYVTSNNDTHVNSRPLVFQYGYGNVGIGVPQPTEKLEVNGNIKATTLKGNLDWSYIQNKPTSLPANGGDADTVDGKHANDFLQVYNNNTDDYVQCISLPRIKISYITGQGDFGSLTIPTYSSNKSDYFYQTELRFNIGGGLKYRNLSHIATNEFKSLLDSSNYTNYINTTNFPGLNATGTVTSVKVGSTSYSPSSGVISLPDYPTSLPANGGDADTVDGKHASDFLLLTGGTMTGWLRFNSEKGISQINGRYEEGAGGWANVTVGSYGPNREIIYNLGAYGQEKTIHYVYLGLNDYNGINFRIYPNKITYGENTILHAGNYTDYVNTTNFPGLDKTGTVTSVGLSVPTGFSVSLSPITTSGTLAISFASGYSLPTTAKQTNWDTVYNWYTGITATDTDALVNKWGEIVDFLDSVAEGTDITDEFVTRKTEQTIDGIKTFSKKIKIANVGSTWLSGKTNASIMYDNYTNIGTQKYHPIIGVKVSNDDVVNLGAYINQVGFYGFKSDRTENGKDWEFAFDSNNGSVTHTSNITSNKFITRNGTSSQFVKGNGDLDSTTYATMTQLDDLQNQLSALSAGIKVTASLSVSTIYKNTATSVKITGTTKDNAGNITASEIVIKEGSTVLATANNVATTSHTKSVTTTSSSIVFTVTAIAQGLPLSTTVTLYARYPIMYGMGTSAENVYTNGSKASARTSAVSTSTYNATASANNVRFYLLVPSDVTRPTSFTMGGAPVDMVIPTATTTIGGIAYYVFYTNAIYNSGAAVQIKAN